MLTLAVFGNDLVLEPSIDNCKLGLHVLPPRRSERHRGTCSLTLLVVQRLPRRMCLQLPLLIVVAQCSTARISQHKLVWSQEKHCKLATDCNQSVLHNTAGFVPHCRTLNVMCYDLCKDKLFPKGLQPKWHTCHQHGACITKCMQFG